MLIRNRKHPFGYHVDRHPPGRMETVIHWMLIALAAIGVCLLLLLQHYTYG